MATQQSTIDFLLEQLNNSLNIRYRKMFGEYAIYCAEKVVALVCDDKLFLKPTALGRKLIPNIEEAPPYPGAKPYFYISADLWEDSDWLSNLISKTAGELPPPKPKKRKKQHL